MPEARVLLCSLSFRTSKAGRTYATGWLGKSRLICFPGELDKFGNRTLDVYVTPVEERREPRRELALVVEND